MRSYVYIYFDPRIRIDYIILSSNYQHEPFYVGKGIDDRLYDHLSETNITNQIKHGKIQHIISEGLQPIIIKVRENLSNDEANDLEKYLISQIGTIAIIDNIKRGPLANLTIGGDGGRQSLETRAKMSKNRKGKGTGPRSEEVKLKISQSKKGISTMTDEGRAKLSEFRKSFITSSETRQKLSASAIGRKHLDDTKQRISAAQKGVSREYAKNNQHSRGLITINNGSRGTHVRPEELEKFLSEGWILGIYRKPN